jgi:hypothetical protein
MRFPKMLPVIVAVVGMGPFAPALAGAHESHRRQDRLEGRDYDRMRELAHRLDELAQHAADQAVEGAHHGGRGERRFLNAITHFARQAADFHERMDRYRESPWDVPGEVDHLIRDARRVNGQIHNAHVFEHTWDDWDAVVDVLVRMQRVVVSEDDRDPYPLRH